MFVCFDWQDVDEHKSISRLKTKIGFDKEYFQTKFYWKSRFDKIKEDIFSILFANFILFKPTDYNRDTFLFIKHVEFVWDEYYAREKVTHPHQALIEDTKFNILSRWLDENRLVDVIESLLLTFLNDVKRIGGLIKLKLDVLNLNVIRHNASTNQLEIETKEGDIKDQLRAIFQTIKDLDITVVLIPNAKNQIMKKKKILVSSANPVDTTWLRLDKEIRRIDEEVNKAGYRDNFEIIKLTATRISDLQDALLRHSSNFVHFSGHGCTDGICLVDDNDSTNIILNKPLAKLFSLFSEEIECVFLNSCYSKEQSEVIRESIPKPDKPEPKREKITNFRSWNYSHKDIAKR